MFSEVSYFSIFNDIIRSLDFSSTVSLKCDFSLSLFKYVLIFIWLHQILVAVSRILVASSGIFPCGAWILDLWHLGFVASGMWDPSSLSRDWTHAPCIGRRILNHWTTREVLRMAFFYQSPVGISLSFSYHSSCLWLPIAIPSKALRPAVTMVPTITNPDVWQRPKFASLKCTAPWNRIPSLDSLQFPCCFRSSALSASCQQPDWLSWDYILAEERLATCPTASPVSFSWVFSSLLCFFSFSCLGYNAANHPGCRGQGPPLGRQCRTLEGACLLRASWGRSDVNCVILGELLHLFES